MKKSLISLLFSITILAIALAASGTVQIDAVPEVAASEQNIGEPIAFPWQPFWLVGETAADMSTNRFMPPCNQGAYCTYRNDPACGPEGFCNLPTNCCMCY